MGTSASKVSPGVMDSKRKRGKVAAGATQSAILSVQVKNPKRKNFCYVHLRLPTQEKPFFACMKERNRKTVRSEILPRLALVPPGISATILIPNIYTQKYYLAKR